MKGGCRASQLGCQLSSGEIEHPDGAGRPLAVIRVAELGARKRLLNVLADMSGYSTVDCSTGLPWNRLSQGVGHGRQKNTTLWRCRPKPHQGMETPALAETCKDFDGSGWQSLWAPAGTPASMLQALHQAALKALVEPELRKRRTDGGLEAVGSAPKQITAKSQRDSESWPGMTRFARTQLDGRRRRAFSDRATSARQARYSACAGSRRRCVTGRQNRGATTTTNR